MRRWQLTGLALGAVALFFTARPAHAQVWVSPGAPVFVAPAPIVVGPAPVVVGPAPVWVGPGWGARPYWGGRRSYRPFRRGGWYGAAWGPRGRGVAFGRRW
jgi:hypothetical protein